MTKNNVFLSVAKKVLVVSVFLSCLAMIGSGFIFWDGDVVKIGNKIDSSEHRVSVLGKVGMAIESEEVSVSEVVLADDARLKLIEAYLERYKSPLLPYSELILELSDNYGFDYRWILAIGQQESNLCKKIPADSYNCWGYGIHSKGTLRFEDYDLALRSFASYLKTQYFDKGYDTPELIMNKYCPHSNGSWAYGIRQFFDEIENGDY